MHQLLRRRGAILGPGERRQNRAASRQSSFRSYVGHCGGRIGHFWHKAVQGYGHADRKKGQPRTQHRGLRPRGSLLSVLSLDILGVNCSSGGAHFPSVFFLFVF